MRATLEYIKQKFDEYNNLMFEGKLKPLPFKLSNAKSFLGAVFFQREKNPIPGITMALYSRLVQ